MGVAVTRPMRPGEAVRRCSCGHVVVARVGQACPRCGKPLGGDDAPAEGVPVGFVVVAGSRWRRVDVPRTVTVEDVGPRSLHARYHDGGRERFGLPAFRKMFVPMGGDK